MFMFSLWPLRSTAWVLSLDKVTDKFIFLVALSLSAIIFPYIWFWWIEKRGSKNADRNISCEDIAVLLLFVLLVGLQLKWFSIHHEFRSICFPSNKNGFKFSNRVHEDGWMGPYLIRMKFLTLLLNDVSSAHVHIFVRKIFLYFIEW